MMKKLAHAAWLLRPLCLLCLPLGSLGCAAQGDQETEHHHGDHAEEGQGHAQEQEGHDEAPSFDRADQDRLSARRCEHDLAILDCDECRYEVGAVEVAEALLDPGRDGLIRTAKVEASPERRRLRLTGEVSFDERLVAHVSPRVDGVVRQVFVTLGDRVERGDRLISMDSLELGQLRSRFLQSRARLELAHKNYEREERLHERRIASGREKLQAETSYREAKIELEGAREQLRLLGLSGSRLETGGAEQLGGGRTALTAPVSGTVVAMHAVQGERIAPEEAVITVADLSGVWVWADVYERDLDALLTASGATKLAATVQVGAFPGRTFEGLVDYVGAVMEEATRTVKVRIDVGNEEGLLRPGMFAEVTVSLPEASSALLVSAEAVVEHEARAFVFVKIGPRRFLRRDVKTRSAGADLVALVEGVEPGEEVVVRGAFLLKSDVLREQMGAGCAH